MTNVEQDTPRKYFDYNALPDKQTRATLRKLTERGKAAESKTVRGIEMTAAGIWEFGEVLTEAKQLLQHGQFQNWIGAEFGISYQKARRSMLIYERLEKFHLCNFSKSPTILYMLSEPAVSDETIDVAIELAKSGDLRTTADAKALIDAAKPPSDAPDEEEDDEDEWPEDRVTSSQNGHSPSPPQTPSTAANTTPVRETQGTGHDSTARDSGTRNDTPTVPTIQDRVEALPLFQALKLYPHRGNIFALNATAWYEEEKLFKAIRAARGRHRYESGPVPSALSVADIPEPEKWEGCQGCKGSLRVGEGADPCQLCKGGFTVHSSEGVSAEVVANYARSSGASEAGIDGDGEVNNGSLTEPPA